ncbi:MAG: S8 family serine peptidase [Myxococcota bacterium]
MAAFVELRPGASPQPLERGGVQLFRAERKVLRFGHWVSVRGPSHEVAHLGTLPGVVAVHRIPSSLAPLDRSSELLGLRHAREARNPMEAWTGRGISIADLDSNVDVFHPDFFRGDAGYFDWIDLNDNFRFDPGIDAIDLDRDGIASGEERTEVLRATLVEFFGNPTDSLTRPGFDPSVDWVYVDTNGSGEREFGAEAGFEDATPAFGEPLFVPDDVNGNGILDPEERLVRLGTSKFAAVMIGPRDASMSGPLEVFRRGADLATIPVGIEDALHASGVQGILAGGVPLPSRRFVGVAPDADLYNASGADARLIWALMQDPDIVLHEYVTWIGVPLDGSDPTSAMIDEASERGTIHVCPGGNIGGAGKHIRRELAADESANLVLEIPGSLSGVFISLQAVGPGTLDAELIGPSLELTPLDTSPFVDQNGTAFVQGQGAVSTRGTQTRDVVIGSIPTGGRFTIRVRAEEDALTVHGMVADEFGFGRATVWEDATDDSTIAWPATADRCIAVGAIPGHTAADGPWFAIGDLGEGELEVRGYSGRGPRIDGDLRPHVVAPDNPWSPLSFGDLFAGPGGFSVAHGSYQVFGGTSGAGPHVAGLVALLLQSGLSPDAARAQLIDSTLADPIAGTLPNNDYGHGRIHAASALGGALDGAPPLASIPNPGPVRVGTELELRVNAPTATEVRWDDDYDGAWDTEYEPLDIGRRFTVLRDQRVKVRVRDDEGRYGEAAVLLRIGEPPPPDAAVPDASTMPDGGIPDASADASVAPPENDDGCGCHVPGDADRRGWLLPVLILALVFVRRGEHRGPGCRDRTRGPATTRNELRAGGTRSPNRAKGRAREETSARAAPTPRSLPRSPANPPTDPT